MPGLPSSDNSAKTLQTLLSMNCSKNSLFLQQGKKTKQKKRWNNAEIDMTLPPNLISIG